MTLLQRILAKVQELRGEPSPISLPQKAAPPAEVEQKVYSSTLESLNNWNSKRDKTQGQCNYSPTWHGGQRALKTCGRGTIGCTIIHAEVSEQTYDSMDWDRAKIALTIAAEKDMASATEEDMRRLQARGGRSRISTNRGR